MSEDYPLLKTAGCVLIILVFLNGLGGLYLLTQTETTAQTLFIIFFVSYNVFFLLVYLRVIDLLLEVADATFGSRSNTQRTDHDLQEIRQQIHQINRVLDKLTIPTNAPPSLSDSDAVNLLEQGRVAVNNKQYQQALGLLTEAIARDPNLALAYHYRAEAYRGLGRNASAKLDENEYQRLRGI